jgi:hypothetical protein
MRGEVEEGWYQLSAYIACPVIRGGYRVLTADRVRFQFVAGNVTQVWMVIRGR